MDPDQRIDGAGLGPAVQEVAERASLLVREEIELAKTEISEKMTQLAKGAAVGAAAGVFVITGLLFSLHSLAWLINAVMPNSKFDPFYGFAVVAIVLFVLGAIAGFVASKAIKRSSPPTPDMAIEEAKLIRDTVQTAGKDAR